MSSADEKKLAGFRASVEQHIAKFDKYPDERDKEFALKTISKDQGHIRDVIRSHPHWPSSWVDRWQPPSDWRKQCR